jgi:PPOX class probable F420-dependent enzyme
MGTDDAYRRLVAADHGVLATLHGGRGADLVPVCFVVHERRLAVPIDRVKAKSTSALQRRANLESDPRATLLVESWDRDDWSKLWWVRANLHRSVITPVTQGIFEPLLREKYPQYRDTEFVELLAFGITRTTGWAAGDRPS